ncbi:MAG TPA: ATP-binding protein, partial [bacterium]|nr:ATP-binding protein [bacterium]
LLPPLLGSTLPTRFAPFSSVVMTAIISYAIAKYRIMDIQLVFEVTTAYVLSSIILIFIYLVAVLATNKLLAVFTTSSQWKNLPLLVGAFIVAVVFVPLRSRLQILLRGLIFKDQYEVSTVSRKLTQLLSQPVKSGELLEEVVKLLNSSLGLVPRAGLVLRQSRQDLIVFPFPACWQVRFKEEGPFWPWFERHREAVVREELLRLSENEQAQQVARELTDLEAEAAAPVPIQGDVAGVLVVGQKVSGAAFGENDRLVLEHLGLQLGLALETTGLYQELFRVNLYLDSLLDNSPAGVVGVDANGRVTVLNREAERLTGLVRKEVIGQPYSVLPGPLVSAVESSLKKKQEIRNEEVSFLPRPSDLAFSAILQTSSFYDRKGQPLGVQVILQDVTQVRVLQEDLRRKDKLASFGVMAARIAHEIKNPLVAIRTLAQLLPSRYQDSEFRNTFANLASREVERINSLVEEILSFASPRQLYPREVNLIELIEATLTMLTVQTEGRKITVHRSWPSERVMIEVDEGKMRQALLNIFLNSRDAMGEEGNLMVQVQESSEMVTVLIRDDGCGMNPEVLKRVFDPFYTTKPRGTGLGLPIVASIVDEHGGTIRMESQENRGTLVILQIPRSQRFRRKT